MNSNQEIKLLIKQELPQILQDPEVRGFVLQSVINYFAGKSETESRFDQILEELRRDRLEQSRKWDEQNRKWDEQNHKWDEQNRKWDETNQEIKQMQQDLKEMIREVKSLNKKYDNTIGALGTRWGLYSEQSFRNALKGILVDSFGVEVINVTEYDGEGEVFGRPEQIELDLLIKNGLLIICEIKSSMSKADMYIFEKKVRFYENRHQRQATRKLVISPMVHPSAEAVARNLRIEVYSYVEDLAF